MVTIQHLGERWLLAESIGFAEHMKAVEVEVARWEVGAVSKLACAISAEDGGLAIETESISETIWLSRGWEILKKLQLRAETLRSATL